MSTPRKRKRLVAAVVVLAALVLAAPGLAKVFSSGNLSKKIPEVGLAKSKIKVTRPGQVTDVNVKVRLSHTYTCDLIVGVQGPGENDDFTELSNDNCDSAGDDADFGSGSKSCSGTPTEFDDEAAGPLSTGVNPYAGSFQPDESLQAYDGERAKGTWTLYVFDINQGDNGKLHCWKLNIKTA
jgi:subtilisin-like proprotein convertase family protein